jgi:hypothetical protein
MRLKVRTTTPKTEAELPTLTPVGTTPTSISHSRIAQEALKAPKVANVVAANVLPRRKAHIPARKEATPPKSRATGMTMAKFAGLKRNQPA